MDTWQTWCMRRTENPENVVRVHECPLQYAGIAQSVERRSPEPKVVVRVLPPQLIYASVAQWIRASRYEREGRKFESCRKYQYDVRMPERFKGPVCKTVISSD